MRRGQQIALAADKKRVPIKRILIPALGGGLIDGIDDRTNRAGETCVAGDGLRGSDAHPRGSNAADHAGNYGQISDTFGIHRKSTRQSPGRRRGLRCYAGIEARQPTRNNSTQRQFTQQ